LHGDRSKGFDDIEKKLMTKNKERGKKGLMRKK
jgi:hypothetical protein